MNKIVAVVGAQVDAEQLEPPLLGEGRDVARRFLGVLADAQPDVETVGLVARLDEHVPDGQWVLSTTDRHEDPVVGFEHLVVLDRPLHLAAARSVPR